MAEEGETKPVRCLPPVDCFVGVVVMRLWFDRSTRIGDDGRLSLYYFRFCPASIFR
jgi:hypothetical protein